jgi:DNA-binding XRE family transcriptional regulator
MTQQELVVRIGVTRQTVNAIELGKCSPSLEIAFQIADVFGVLLEWRQVDLQAGEVRLDAGTTKNGDGRVFPFTTALRQVLDDQRTIAETLKGRGITTRHVFCFTHGPKAGQPIAEAAYIHQWWKARIVAECPGPIPHDFRRTAVRNLVRAGVPERVAMQLTGHKTRAVFERYNIVSPGDLREAARRLDTFAAGS